MRDNKIQKMKKKKIYNNKKNNIKKYKIKYW